MPPPVLEKHVKKALANRRVVLAVSGGADSMALLIAASRVARRSVVAVANFDHGTGSAAAAAQQLVAGSCRELGLRFVGAQASQGQLPTSEASWRSARWEFLHEVVAQLESEGAEVRADAALSRIRIATAHTLDDHLETVAMRILRGSGTRGLAGLLAEGDLLRPLLQIRRPEIQRYLDSLQIDWMEDPTNLSRRFLRNRLRHDLLPALRQVNPHFDAQLISIAERASELRQSTEAVAATVGVELFPGGRAAIDLRPLARRSETSLAELLPALFARVGVRLDRRAIRRLTHGIRSAGKNGKMYFPMQLSGRLEVDLSGGKLLLGPLRGRSVSDASGEEEMHLRESGIEWRLADAGSSWSFNCVRGIADDDMWCAWLPSGDATIVVRPWASGDRMRTAGHPDGRRVKRFLSDAGVRGADRMGWPVVVVDEEVVWIPGIRRGVSVVYSDKAAQVAYRCTRVGP